MAAWYDMGLLRQSNTGLNLRFAVSGAAIFSGMVNLLGLTGPMFMLEVYDRAIPSRSIPTLGALFILAAGLYAFSGLFDVLRFPRDGAHRFRRRCRAIGPGLRHCCPRAVKGAGGGGDALRPARDLDQVRGFLTSQGPIGAVRSAVDTSLCRCVLPAASFDRMARDLRHCCAGRIDNRHRYPDPTVARGCGRRAGRAKQVRRGRQPRRGSFCSDGG